MTGDEMLRRLGAATLLLALLSGPVHAQPAALGELDSVIAEIKERYLGETPRPVIGEVRCSMGADELVETYIAAFELFEEFDARVQNAAEVERRANTAIAKGDFCDRSIVAEQQRAIESVQALDLDGVMVDAQMIAECAPVLQEAAELRLPSLRSPAQLAVLQQEIDTLRNMRGHALQIASRMGFARDLRMRIVDVMEGNVSVCG